MEKKSECEIVQDLLIGYVDGVLNNESKKLVENHLKDCVECQEKLKSIQEDISSGEKNEQKEIDYLKKIRIKSRIKSIFLAIGIILVILIIVYLYKFMIVNSIFNKADESLQTSNFYKEKRELIEYEGEVMITKYYYKDGKSKTVTETYSDEGNQVIFSTYAEVGSDEKIEISEINKTVTIQKGELIKRANSEENLKSVSFIRDSNLLMKLGIPIIMSIKTDTYDVGREYYILNNNFENNKRWEIWIDKETGLPLKEINRGSVKTFYPGTDIVKSISDDIQEYRYEFGIVTEEDVEIPSFEGYEVKQENIDINM